MLLEEKHYILVMFSLFIIILTLLVMTPTVENFKSAMVDSFGVDYGAVSSARAEFLGSGQQEIDFRMEIQGALLSIKGIITARGDLARRVSADLILGQEITDLTSLLPFETLSVVGYEPGDFYLKTSEISPNVNELRFRALFGNYGSELLSWEMESFFTLSDSDCINLSFKENAVGNVTINFPKTISKYYPSGNDPRRLFLDITNDGKKAGIHIDGPDPSWILTLCWE